MLETILQNTLLALVAFLAQEAVKIFGGNPGGAVDPNNNPVGQQHHQWITEMVNEFFDVLEEKSPAWIRPEEEQLKPVLDSIIQTELAKLGI